MKQCFLLLTVCCLLFVACKKTEGGTTRIIFYNGTYSIAALQGAWNGGSLTANPLAQAQYAGSAAAPYLALPAGTNNITVTAGARTFLDKNAYTAMGNNYTLLVYDTAAKDSSVNTLLLADDLTLPDTANAKCRFINCAPDTTQLVPVIYNKIDTLAFSTGNFIGNKPSASAVQPFANVKKGKYAFVIVQKPTGIPVFAATDSLSFTSQSIYSLIYSGLKTATGARGIKFNLLMHNVQ